MRFDPSDPNLGKKINDLFAEREKAEEAPSYSQWQDAQGQRDSREPEVARPFDDVQREQDARIAETRRRRDLGKEGRDAEREAERGGGREAAEEDRQQQPPRQDSGQMTDFERRILQVAESIDEKFTNLGALP